MKQKGSDWYTAEGKSTLAKYLPAHERLFEKLGQKIATEAVASERALRVLKADFVAWCKEALRNNPDKNISKRFSFTTFDREYRIEFDIEEEYVRVYRATKKNPSSKDYEQVIMDFSRAKGMIQADGGESVAPLPYHAMDPIQLRREIENERLQDQLEGIQHIPATMEGYGRQTTDKGLHEPDGPTDDAPEEQPSLFPQNTGKMEFES